VYYDLSAACVRCVSILILLEVLLQLLTLSLQHWQLLCFNPYFIGSSTSTRSSRTHDFQSHLCFNPYFTGSSTSTTFATKVRKEELPFQSLFYWKFYFNNLNKQSKKKLRRSFNPYFTGSSTSTSQSQYNRRGYFEFQSLFYWKFYFNYNVALVLM